jgi:hypothetical protein
MITLISEFSKVNSEETYNQFTIFNEIGDKLNKLEYNNTDKSNYLLILDKSFERFLFTENIIPKSELDLSKFFGVKVLIIDKIDGEDKTLMNKLYKNH